MSKYGIMATPITDRIYIGRLNKANTEMLDDKEDHSDSACAATAEYILNKYDGAMVLQNSKVKVTITVSKEVKS